MTLQEIEAICESYGLLFYIIPYEPMGVGHVRAKGHYMRVCNFLTMTSDRFESLALPMVIEGTFTP